MGVSSDEEAGSSADEGQDDQKAVLARQLLELQDVCPAPAPSLVGGLGTASLGGQRAR